MISFFIRRPSIGPSSNRSHPHSSSTLRRKPATDGSRRRQGAAGGTEPARATRTPREGKAWEGAVVGRDCASSAIATPSRSSSRIVLLWRKRAVGSHHSTPTSTRGGACFSSHAPRLPPALLDVLTIAAPNHLCVGTGNSSRSITAADAPSTPSISPSVGSGHPPLASSSSC